MKHSNRNISIRWSPLISYIVGLIVSDGSLSKDGRHIDFTSSDIELIKIVSDGLELTNKISKKKSGYTNTYNSYHIQFSYIAFYKWLNNIGIFSNKSKTIKHVTIPNYLFFHFLRGYFDGDGTIYSYFDIRWKNSYMFYLSFSSGSKTFLEWINSKIFIFTNKNGRITKAGNTWILRYAKSASLVIIDKMYFRHNNLLLKRKYLKIQKITTVDSNNKKARVLESVDSYA